MTKKKASRVGNIIIVVLILIVVVQMLAIINKWN